MLSSNKIYILDQNLPIKKKKKKKSIDALVWS